MSDAPIVLAAGGTGGHIFPAESLAEELVARGEQVVLITDKRFADYNTNSDEGVLGNIPIHYIHAGSMGGGLIKKLRSGFSIIIGIMQARSLLKKLGPKAVVGFGGYPSFPTMMAASRMGLNTIIHEQNSVLGKANRMLVERVRRIATSYEKTKRLPTECHGKTTPTGNPVRAAVRALHDIPYPVPQDDGTLRILVTGGSQGAHVFSDIVPEAIRQLPEPMRLRVRIDQQCRASDIEPTRQAYKEMGLQADIAPFFGDLPARLASAHLVVCRAGASTIAELTCAGRPAILVPYPRATDNHQYYNAQSVEDADAGWLMPQEGFTAIALANRLEALLSLPTSLSKAAKQMHGLGKPDAAKRMADLVLDLASGVEVSAPKKTKSKASADAGKKEKAA